MDIFKLFFNHDLRLDTLAKRNANKSKKEIEATLQDFMQPDPTYSKFYITGTFLDEEKFGINTLSKSEAVLDQLNAVFNNRKIISTTDHSFSTLPEAFNHIAIGDAIILKDANQSITADLSTLTLDEESKVGHKKEEIRSVIESGAYLIFKEPAHHGFDLHLFSEKNIYDQLFGAFQPLVDNNFRFFSINNKRMRSERHFYFETWTLDKPPHGAEEVFQSTSL